MKSGITVTATGEWRGKPDKGVVRLGASRVHGNAGSALAEVNKAVENLLEVLNRLGVDKSAIQTSRLGLWPQTDQNGNQVGYRAENTVRVTFDLERQDPDPIISAGLEALGTGATMHGIEFGIKNTEVGLVEARNAAWDNVRRKAEQLAALAGVQLGSPLSIEEASGGAFRYQSGGMDMAESMPVEPGSVDLSVTIMARFALLG